ncbi:MAG TPA: hypothetical protein VFT21_00935 [Gemmatimonadaceae bacterium]|nr:hypothetical protein [Gemmatimonadaceae bacterium]
MTLRRFASRVLAGALIVVPSLASAQSILLQIKPHVGDTLDVRLDQRIEMTGTPAACPKPQACPASARRMTTTTEVFSKAIVKSMNSDGARVLAVTDSIRTASSRGSVVGKPRRVKTRGDRIELRVSREGGAEVIDAEASDELRAIFGQMPATLSDKPVRIGGKWNRQMRMPIAGEAGAIGMIRATFQLDSLGTNGDIAYISMRGTLSHDHRDGSVSEVDGWMTGSIQLDRRLAWITETRAEIDVTSMVRGAPGAEPMRVRTRVLQHLTAWPAR